MSRQHLTLHIGYHKTGSTSLQSFLDDERAALAQAGVCYPQTKGDGSRDYFHKHLAFFIALQEAETAAERQALVTAMGDEIEASGARRAILSEESFSGAPPAMIEALARLGDRFDVEVVAVIRRQDHFLQSWYQQTIRDFGNRKDFLAFLQTGDWARLHYDTALQTWADHFARLRVLSHDREAPTGGVMRAILAPILGAALPRLLPRERRWHESHPAILYEALRQMNRRGLSRPELEAVWAGLRRLKPAARQRLAAAHPDLFARGYLTPEIAATIAAEFAASNRRTAEHFFGGLPPFPDLPLLDDGARIGDLAEAPGFAPRDTLAAVTLVLAELAAQPA